MKDRKNKNLIKGFEKNNRKSVRRTPVIRRVFACFLVVALILNILPTSMFERTGILPERTAYAANKDKVPADTVYSEENQRVKTLYLNNGIYDLSNVTRILEYSRAYYSFPTEHQNDVIRIGYTVGESVGAIENFIAIGTEGCPFKGTVRLISSGGYNLQLPEAFFDYVYDSVQIIKDDTEAPLAMMFERTTTDSEPVLARHVKHDPDLASTRTWKVQIDPYSGNNYSTSGFIGEMMDGAMLNLEIDDNTSMNIVNNASEDGDIKDVGYVCGKLGAGSSLTVSSITGTNTAYSVTSAAGHAGGVVGSMQSGSTLTLGCKMKNPAAAVTASGAGNYAGGIAGYNVGGIVKSGITQTGVDENKDPIYGVIFSSSSKYSIQNTVAGKAGAGGVFGYYKPLFTANETTGINEASFDIAWLQIGTDASSRMAANGEGYAGGLFGVLENEIVTTTTTGEGNEAVTTTSYSSGNITITDSSDNAAVVYANHADGSMTGYGGIAGKYTACDLTGALLVNDVSVNVARSGGSYTCYGGGIGETVGIHDNATSNGVYAQFNDFQATVASGNTTTSAVYGGLVALSHNSFIDAVNVTVSSSNGFIGGGVIGTMENGILRLSGTTDLSGGYPAVSAGYSATAGYYANQGQIVGGRDSSLVFADSGWILKRCDACEVDDIGSWGEVLRFGASAATTDEGTGITTTVEEYGNDAVLSINESTHAVSVASQTITSNATTINSVADFAKVALCFQLDAANNPYLDFTGTWGNCTDIVSTDITLGADIVLTDTGLTGFTRDNPKGYVANNTTTYDTTYCVYSGKFDGGNHSITLAIGQPYGNRGEAELSSHVAEGNGKIYRHTYSGLFGVIDGNYDTTDYTVKVLTILGTVDIDAKVTTFYCGSYAARSLQDFTANNIVTGDAFVMTDSGDAYLYMGRLVGEMASDTDSIVVSNSTFGGTISGDNSGANTCLGGVIGKVSHNADADRTWDFSSVTLQGTIGNNSAKAAQRIGGLIAEIDGSYNNNSKHRTLKLEGITVNGLNISGTLSSGGSMGGLLGYGWNKVDVDATSVTVQDNTTDSSIKSTVDIGSVAGNTAGLVYRATGHWKVTSIDIDNIKMTASGASSVGMLVNRGFTYSGNNTTFYTAANRSAIYLELPASYTYKLVLDSGSNIKSSAVFDELCAYTCPSSSDIMKNGNGVISINTTFKTDGSTASGTYHAQTSKGAKPNPNSRYYYNLDTMDSVGTPTDTSDPAKLMMWGLNQYACNNLKQYFTNPYSDGSIENSSGSTFNMNGYSWYPVNLDNNITLNGTFKLYNKEFEGSEKVKYNNESSNAYKRTSLYDSTNSSNTQHYLMHNALFNDVNSSTLTIGTVVLQGDVAGYSTSGSNASVCGALVCGTVAGSSTAKVATVKMGSTGSISLDGIRIYNVGGAVDNALDVSGYAPLLINKVGSHSSLNLSNVSTTAGYNDSASSDTAATSLIGDVGNSSATNINVDFKLITLDGRNATGKTDTDLSATDKGNFFAMYNTYNSIFSKATLLNSFSFDSSSSGRYDFTWEQDWNVDGNGDADAAHAGHVTYGKELGYDSSNYPKTGAVNPKYNSQYPDEEFKYSQSTKFTNPITASEGESTHAYAANFLTNFIPYVAVKYDLANKKYQLQVNHGKVDTSGCGTYNHPYMISIGKNIEDYSSWISDGGINADIRIPTSGLVFDEDDDHKIIAITGTWCTDQQEDALCSYSTTNRFESKEVKFSAVDDAAKLAAVNPSALEWYESSGESTYTPTTDTVAQSEKTYYALSYGEVTPADTANPSEEGWFESDGADPAEYTLTSDDTVEDGKKYYVENYTAVTVLAHVSPQAQDWYERSGSDPNYIYTKTVDNTIQEKTYYKGDTVYFEEDVLRTYLAGAYYKVATDANNNDLIIDETGFKGFGASDNVAYRFRGVFDGSGKIITNKTGSPFIYYSNGCVVKDLTIKVLPTSDILLVGFQKNFDNMWAQDKNEGGNAAYGAVIARVMGGDNIIDNVTVNYADMAKQFIMRAKFAQLVPLGGYVGVVVNGGVVFKNMSTAATAYASSGLNNSKIKQEVTTKFRPASTDLVAAGTYTSNTSTDNFMASNAWLYINPYVGRVINGYAINETTAYRPFESGERQYDGEKDTDTAVTLQNGSKHYSITDINIGDTIGVDENTVNANSGQDLFIMSLIINSGMSKNELGYNQDYQVSRSASYEYVGTNTKTDHDSDAKDDVLDDIAEHKSTKYGYLVTKYASTQPTDGFADNANLTIVLSANAVLPDGFKGFGNLFQANDNYRIKINTFNGGGYTVSQNTSYYYYDTDIQAYSPQTTNAGGLGLINYASSAATYKNMYLKGIVKTDLINTTDGTFITSKKPSDLDGNKYLCAGMLIGTAGATTTVNDLALTNIDVFGLRNTGGLIGFETAGTLTYTIVTSDENLYNSDKIKVHGRASTGGMLGKINPGYVKVDMKGHTFNLSEVVCDNENERGGNYWDFGVGGFIGMMRAGYEIYTTLDVNANYFKNIVIGTENNKQIVSSKSDIFTGGVIGIMNKCRGITIVNCDFYNLSVDSKLAAAGLVAFPTTATPTLVKNTHLYSPLGSVIDSSSDFAGGLIGSSDPREGVQHGSGEFTFDNCSISGYSISGKLGAGGVIGFRGASGTLPLYIKNTKVSDCTIKSDDGVLGGLIGEMNNSVAGYNILVTDISFDSLTELEEGTDPSYTAGYICGSINTSSARIDYIASRTGTSPTIKFAGFSRQDSKSPDTMIEALIGTNNAGGNYGTDGYVVFADYNDKATSAPNEEFANIYSSNNVPMAEEIVSLPNGSKTTTSKYRVVVDSGNSVSIDGAAPYETPVVTESDEMVENPATVYSAGKKVGYETVVPDNTNLIQVTSVSQLTGEGSENGFYMCLDAIQTGNSASNRKVGPFYIDDYINNNNTDNRVIAETSAGDVDGAACWFFEEAEISGKYHIYTVKGGTRYYICSEVSSSNSTGDNKYANLTTANTSNRYIDTFEIVKSEMTGFTNCFIIQKWNTTNNAGKGWWLQHSGNRGGIRYWNDKQTTYGYPVNYNFKFYYAPSTTALRTTEYSTITDENGTLVFSGPGTPRIPTGSEASDFETLCNNSEDKELYYVTETVTENNLFIPGSNIQPFVTTSPKVDIDNNQFLTGDGVGYINYITYANSAIGKILTDVSGGTEAKRYSFAQDEVGADATADLIAKLKTYGRLSSYRTEMGANAMTSKNFPVLIVDEVLEKECTDFINEYLQYMTNTDFDFASGNSDVFNIEIGSMIWDSNDSEFKYTSGAYNATTNPNGAYLSNNTANGKFKIDGGYDNTEVGRFTLLDVQFYDPGDTGSAKKIAYHLYVPILVKKMLLYDFYASTLSGTNYRIAPYDAARDNTLIENTGNPVTMEIQWKYHRNLEEWQMALESGDNLLMALDKKLKLRIPTNTFPSGTKMVLVDPNDDNKHYYATSTTTDLIVADTGSNVYYTFDLSKFSDKLTGTPTTTFSPIYFSDFFDFTVTGNASSEGDYDKVILEEGVTETVEHYIEAGATMRVEKDNGGYDYYKPNSASTGAYDITMSYKAGVSDASTGYLTENYYISFFTDINAPTTDNKDLYHLDFYDRGTFGNSSLPTKAVLTQHTHILTGDIFVNEFTIDPNSLTSAQRMTASNDTLRADLIATVGINEDLRAEVRGFLSPTNTNVSIYQSMLVMLNRMEEGSQEKGILAKPAISVKKFTITHSITTGEGEEAEKTVYTDVDGVPDSMSPFNDDTVTANYIEIRDNINLRNYLYQSCYGGYNLDIKATVNLAYSSSEIMSAQFPTRDSSNLDNENIGTIIGASSNISSVSSAAAYSKTSTPHWTNKAYYCTINTNAILTLNSDDSKNIFGDYYQLGINELDMEAENLDLDEDGNSKMKLNATYNVSDLSAAGTAKAMKLVISVRKKADYSVKLDIDDYIKDLVLYDANDASFKAAVNSTLISCTETADAVEYTYIVKDPETTLDYDMEGRIYQIPITFTAYSGANFNKQYSNYMIHLEIELYKDYAATADYIEGSRDDDHVIWTNAKIAYSVFDN